jgi:hypothetical protein
MLKNLSIICFALLFAGCGLKDPPRKYDLKAIPDFTFDFNYYDSAFISKGGQSLHLKWSMDKYNYQVYQCYDLPEGEYIFEFKTALNERFTVPVVMDDDTIFNLTNNLILADSIERQDILTSDSITVVFTINGSKNIYYERTTIKKKGEGYEVEMISDDWQGTKKPIHIKKQMAHDIIEGILDLQPGIELEKEAMKKGNVMWSDKKMFYLRVKNKFFKYSDTKARTWFFYDKFIDAYLVKIWDEPKKIDDYYKPDPVIEK